MKAIHEHPGPPVPLSVVSRHIVPAIVVCTALAFGASFAAAQDGQESPEPQAHPHQIHSCEDDPGFHALDFWLGDWDVKSGGRIVGTNRIERILKGCALMENWTAEDGSQGKSLFYYDPSTEVWKQVWVTDAAYSPGGLKEKTLVERMDDHGLRFQGEIALKNGGTYLDRTTLTPNRNGTVRQWIQISTDDGETWTTTFDAIYVRKAKAAR